MYDAIVVGGGVIGLAIARALGIEGQSVLVMEQQPAIAQEASFRNSAVLHSGLYYPEDSWKAKFCSPGKRLLEQYCKAQGITFRTMGKLIVAQNEQHASTLEHLAKQGSLNGVTSLAMLTSRKLTSLEPNLKAHTALFVPHTGIIDGQALMTSLADAIRKCGGHIIFNTTAIKAQVDPDGFHVLSQSNQTFSSKRLINAAGLRATDFAHTIEDLAANTIPKTYYAKGNYFKYLRSPPFQKLIYPVPEQAGLGIHATLDLAGNMRFGPDVEWITALDYTTTQERKPMFVEAIRQYFPSIDPKDLEPDQAHTGIRAKILPPEQQPQDFLISTQAQHSISGLVNLFGIESPGLTSCLAIADYVVNNI